MDKLAFNKALQSIWELVAAANKYIDDTAPWALAKDENEKERLATVMYNLLESIRLITLFITPFMPSTGARVTEILGGTSENLEIETLFVWGGLKPGTKIEKTSPLFPRIEAE